MYGYFIKFRDGYTHCLCVTDTMTSAQAIQADVAFLIQARKVFGVTADSFTATGSPSSRLLALMRRLDKLFGDAERAPEGIIREGIADVEFIGNALDGARELELKQ